MAKALENIVEEIGGLTVLELADLVKLIETKFDVTAAAPMAGAAAATAAPAAEEKSEFKVELLEIGASKLEAIKALRKIQKDLGLIEAKKLVESAPVVLAEAANKETANALKEVLEAVGAKVKLS